MGVPTRREPSTGLACRSGRSCCPRGRNYTRAIRPAPSHAPFGSALRTLRRSTATGRLGDLSPFRMRPETRLEIVRASESSETASIKLEEGEVYFSNHGPARSIPISTPQADAVALGTEFVIK